MLNQQLTEYVRQELSKGVAKESLRTELLQKSWNEQEIRETFIALGDVPPGLPSVSLGAPEAPVKSPQVTSTALLYTVAAKPVRTDPKQSAKLPVLIISIVLLLAAGGAAAYYGLVVAPLPSPVSVLQKALPLIGSESSAAFVSTTTGEVSSHSTSSIPYNVKFTINTNGKTDRHDAGDPSSDISISANISTNTATDTGKLALSLHLLYVKKELYLNLQNFQLSFQSKDPKEAQAQMYVGLANSFVVPLENKWISLGTSTAHTILPVGTSSPQVTADLQSLEKYGEEMSYLVDTRNAGVEKVSGTDTYHLKLTLRLEQRLVDLWINLLSDEGGSKVTSDQLKSIRTEFSSHVGDEAKLDVWVGKQDSMIYKVALLPLTIRDAKTETAFTVSDESTTGDHNKAFLIAPPASSESIEKAFQDLFQAQAPAKAPAKKK